MKLRMVQVDWEDPAYQAFLAILDVTSCAIDALGDDRAWGPKARSLMRAGERVTKALERLLDGQGLRYRERAFAEIGRFLERLDEAPMGEERRGQVVKLLSVVVAQLSRVKGPALKALN